MKTILATILLGSFVLAAPAANAERKPAKVTREASDQIADLASAAVEENRAAILAAAAAGELTSIKIRTIGREPWDSAIKDFANSAIKRAGITLRFNASLKDLGFPDVLDPASLARRHNYTESYSILTRAEDALSIMQRDMTEFYKEREERARRNPLASTAENQAELASRGASRQALIKEWGIVYRKYFAIEREVVAFMQKHDDEIRWDGDNFGFANENTVTSANELFDRLNAAVIEIEQTSEKEASAN